MTSTPHWKPSTDGELDAWGRGYFTGHDRGYADAMEALGVDPLQRPETTTTDSTTAQEV